MTRLPLFALLLAAGGCVYYNGMYNARRFAHSADKAERDGRTLEANGLWGQVAVKAESVITRHPDSKWVDEARLLRGRALEHLGDCATAVKPLELSAASTASPEVVEAAILYLGQCRERLGDAEAATREYTRLLGSKNPVLRSEALFRHGRAERTAGHYQLAFDELSASRDPRAQGELAAALAGMGRIPEALSLADSLVIREDTLAPWDSLFALVGRRDVETASALVDRVIVMKPVQPGQRARWLLADAERLAAASSPRTLARLDQAAGVGEAGLSARLASVRISLATTESAKGLDSAADRLEDLRQIGGPVAETAYQLFVTITGLRGALDSVRLESPQGDLRLFLIAEHLRDSVEAPRLAADLFAKIAAQWPGSPYTPKALLALVQLRPEVADSVGALLLGRYADSPYAAVLRGEDSPGYHALEDSLQLFAATTRFDGRRPLPNQPRLKPGAVTRDPADN